MSLHEFGDNFICTGKIISLEKKTDYSYKYVFEIDSIKGSNNQDINVSHRNIKVYLYINEKLEYGDVLICNIEFDKPLVNTNIGGFNTKLFLYSNEIVGYGYVEKLLHIEKASGGVVYTINKIKYKICEIIDNSFDTDVADIIKTMLLNDESTIDEDVKNKFYDIGISHILVPSSSHLMYILLFFTYLISLLRISSRYKGILTVTVILIYLIITNFAISILRVFLMYILTYVLNFWNESSSGRINILCTTLTIILINNPLMLYNVGMLLSFGSILGIELFYKKINNIFQYGLNRKNNRFICRIIDMISITLAVQIIILPILINTFNTVYITALFANVIAVPLSRNITYIIYVVCNCI